MADKTKESVYCDFCGKSRDEVKKMNFFQKIGHNFKYLLLGESAFSK